MKKIPFSIPTICNKPHVDILKNAVMVIDQRHLVFQTCSHLGKILSQLVQDQFLVVDIFLTSDYRNPSHTYFATPGNEFGGDSDLSIEKNHNKCLSYITDLNISV